MPVHTCPVCGAAHEVHPILHGLAYGNQLSCSPHCKTEFPHLVYSRIVPNVANDTRPWRAMSLPLSDTP